MHGKRNVGSKECSVGVCVCVLADDQCFCALSCARESVTRCSWGALFGRGWAHFGGPGFAEIL